MKKLLLSIAFVLCLSGCADKPNKSPEVAFKGTTAEELIDKPDRELMRKLPPKKKLEYGQDNAKNAEVVSSNNLRAGTAERRLGDLQQFVCNIFKDPVGEVCDKTK